MATIREQLKKITELYVPRAGDEREFVAKHRVEIIDKQGKDSISQETPYELILKNIAAVKAPPHAGEDHGHEAPGESEAAYHIPESREAIIAKLSEMMGNEKDEDEEEEEKEDDDEEEDEDDEDEKEMKEAKKQVVGVEMHYTHPTKKPFKITHFSAQDAEKGRKEYEKMGYKLAGKKAQFGEEVDIEEGLLDKAKTVVKNVSGIVNPKTPQQKAASIQRRAMARHYMTPDDKDRRAAGMEPLSGVPRLAAKFDGLKRAAKPYIKAALKGVREQADIEEAALRVQDTSGSLGNLKKAKPGTSLSGQWHAQDTRAAAAGDIKDIRKKTMGNPVARKQALARANYAVTRTNEEAEQIDEAEREAGYKMPPHVRAGQIKFDLQSAIKRSRQAGTHSPDVEGMRNKLQQIKKQIIHNT